MHDRARETLRTVISLALTMVPRSVRRAYADRLVLQSDPARATITARLVKDIERHFEVTEKPDPDLVPPLGSRKAEE